LHWSRHPAVLESVEVLSHDVALRVMAYRHNQFQLQQHWMQMMMTQQQQQQQHQQRPMRMIQQHPGGGGLGWVPNIVDLSIARMQQHPPPAASELHGAAAAAYNLGLQYYYRQHQHNMAAYYQSSRVVPHHDNPVVSNAACLSPPNHDITEAAKLKAPIDDDDNVVPNMAMYKSNTKMEQRAIIKKAEKKRTYCRGPYRKRKPKLVHRVSNIVHLPKGKECWTTTEENSIATKSLISTRWH
jgi:hypothetical protein